MVDEISRCGAGGVVWGIMGGLGIGLPPVSLFIAVVLLNSYPFLRALHLDVHKYLNGTRAPNVRTPRGHQMAV